MAGIPEHHSMVKIEHSEIGKRVSSDCWDLYKSKVKSLILNLQQSTYCLETKGWETLIQDKEKPDSPFVGSISMKYAGNHQRAYLHYDKDLQENLLAIWERKCQLVGLQFKKLKGGHLLNDELFRITDEYEWPVGSLIQQGMSDERVIVEVRLCLQYLGMSWK